MTEFDPTLLGQEFDFELDMTLTMAATDYAESLALVDEYQKQYDPLLSSDMLGEKPTNLIPGNLQERPEEKREITEEEFKIAALKASELEETFLTFAEAYCSYTLEQSKDFFDSLEEVEHSAWTSTWKRLHSVLSGMQGTSIVDVAKLFDLNIRAKYYENYDPQARDRGLGNIDTSAQTFYEVFADHLSRAITRPTEDGWTGQ